MFLILGQKTKGYAMNRVETFSKPLDTQSSSELLSPETVRVVSLEASLEELNKKYHTLQGNYSDMSSAYRRQLVINKGLDKKLKQVCEEIGHHLFLIHKDSKWLWRANIGLTVLLFVTIIIAF